MADVHGSTTQTSSNVNDIFVDTEYEDKQEVLESEVKDALWHTTNRKAAGDDDIPL